MSKPAPPQITKATKGFTLVEIVVALGIVALALAAGLRTSGAQINYAERSVQNLKARLCAQNQLMALRLSRQFPATGSGTTPCVQAGETLSVETQVQPTPNPSIRRVDVAVHPEKNAADLTLLHLSSVLGRF